MTTQVTIAPDSDAEAAAAAEAAALKRAEEADKLVSDLQKGEDPQPAPSVATKPEGVPDKFWDAEKGEVRVEDLLKSYSELEKARSKGGEGQGGDDASQQVEEQNTQAAEAVQAAGFEYSALQQEWADNGGQLSEETLAKLEASGITRQMVSDHIAGIEALAERGRQEAFSLVGGEENYFSMIEWATANLSPTEQAAYDEALGKPNAHLAIEGLYAKFQRANGVEPKLINGGTQVTPGDRFTSNAQVTAAMRDPRYAIDPAYRAEVEAKLARSDVFGVRVV